MNWLTRIAGFNEELTNIAKLRNAAPGMPMSPQSRDFLNKFLNSIEPVFRRQGQLSARQQSRWEEIKNKYGLR